MILDLVRDGFTLELLLNLCVRVFAIFCVLPIHEYAHGLVANKLGDDTARLQGRLTLNPLAHIDPIGALMIVLVGFGYAKPVPVNISKFKVYKRKQYMALVAFAGPLSNMIMATIFSFFYVLFDFKLGASAATEAISLFFFYASSINISLAVFNLLPIPPLDGSKILAAVLPNRLYFKLMQYERYIVLVVFALLFMGVLTVPLSLLSTLLQNLIFRIVTLPFSLLGV